MLRRVFRDEAGSVLVEGTLTIALFLLLALGSVEFMLAFYQWNLANKAVERGVRIAVVSDPVSSDITAMTGVGGGVVPYDPMPYFERVCNGATASCSGGTYNAAAMSRIVFGRDGGGTCGVGDISPYTMGMCDIFPRITPANVIVTYTQTGLGFAGRPGGPSPTVTVRLQNLTFQFYFLGGLAGLSNLTIPGMTATMAGEDLRSTAN
jgi:hypothetical protein